MSQYKWISDKTPDNYQVKQVYGIVFSKDGRVFLRIEDFKYQLTGGKPEESETFEETLKREYLEEVNVEIEDIHYLGYLLVDEENGIPPYAQVRMIGKIKRVGPLKPDTDNGKIYQRLLVSPSNVKNYLKYSGTAGNLMIEDALYLAREKYEFLDVEEKKEFV